ncbi:hypothetical protein P171DRAFT_526438 [Karstenula rhodostoma CBS 690.94]|uniref:Uncharacterized protein n=1 Tax=Karstenula rhodostoma CBS 690.94 TaxID=1392251 RepID=A0A9P4P4H6_9PLEO|nr:hypothetical protein P171DRAFT_526438 [Karstenula rhodostoma CBS 690.94]
MFLASSPDSRRVCDCYPLENTIQYVPAPVSLEFGSDATTLGHTNQTRKLVAGKSVTLVMLLSFYEADPTTLHSGASAAALVRDISMALKFTLPVVEPVVLPCRTSHNMPGRGPSNRPTISARNRNVSTESLHRETYAMSGFKQRNHHVRGDSSLCVQSGAMLPTFAAPSGRSLAWILLSLCIVPRSAAYSAEQMFMLDGNSNCQIVSEKLECRWQRQGDSRYWSDKRWICNCVNAYEKETSNIRRSLSVAHPPGAHRAARCRLKLRLAGSNTPYSTRPCALLQPSWPSSYVILACLRRNGGELWGGRWKPALNLPVLRPVANDPALAAGEFIKDTQATFFCFVFNI